MLEADLRLRIRRALRKLPLYASVFTRTYQKVEGSNETTTTTDPAGGGGRSRTWKRRRRSSSHARRFSIKKPKGSGKGGDVKNNGRKRDSTEAEGGDNAAPSGGGAKGLTEKQKRVREKVRRALRRLPLYASVFKNIYQVNTRPNPDKKEEPHSKPKPKPISGSSFKTSARRRSSLSAKRRFSVKRGFRPGRERGMKENVVVGEQSHRDNNRGKQRDRGRNERETKERRGKEQRKKEEAKETNDSKGNGENRKVKNGCNGHVTRGDSIMKHIEALLKKGVSTMKGEGAEERSNDEDRRKNKERKRRTARGSEKRLRTHVGDPMALPPVFTRDAILSNATKEIPDWPPSRKDTKGEIDNTSPSKAKGMATRPVAPPPPSYAPPSDPHDIFQEVQSIHRLIHDVRRLTENNSHPWTPGINPKQSELRSYERDAPRRAARALGAVVSGRRNNPSDYHRKTLARSSDADQYMLRDRRRERYVEMVAQLKKQRRSIESKIYSSLRRTRSEYERRKARGHAFSGGRNERASARESGNACGAKEKSRDEKVRKDYSSSPSSSSLYISSGVESKTSNGFLSPSLSTTSTLPLYTRTAASLPSWIQRTPRSPSSLSDLRSGSKQHPSYYYLGGRRNRERKKAGEPDHKEDSCNAGEIPTFVVDFNVAVEDGLH